MSAIIPDTQTGHLDWFEWLRHELAPSHERKVQTLILVCGVVLSVIISTTLAVPELALSAYMVFFISKENKRATTMVGALGLIGLTIGIVLTLLLYKITYGHPEMRIPFMAVSLFLGMFLSRALVLGPLAFLLGFVLSYTQSIGEMVPSPELLVRASLWIWVAVAYGVALAVLLNQLFMPKPTGPAKPVPKGLFVPDAFTNPAHVHFALKITLAAMFCYFFYIGADWTGIHTSFITCIFISLETTGATLYKGILRIVGCIIGALLALFSILVLIPHMESLASLVVLVACVSAIAGWVATGSERIAYGGLQIIFAFFYSLFPGFQPYKPDTDLTNVRDRVFGILLGLFVTTFIFQYVWPERAIDRLRDILRQVFRRLVKLLVIPNPEAPINEAKSQAKAWIAETSNGLEKARRVAEVMSLEINRPQPRETISSRYLETMLSRAEHLLAIATSLNTDAAWQEWQGLPREVQEAESELRNLVAKQFDRAIMGNGIESDADVSNAFARWSGTIRQFSLEGTRTALISQVYSLRPNAALTTLP